MSDESKKLLDRDRASLWHPYASTIDPAEVFPVVSASGTKIRLADGSEVIDGMASWWCAIHGYNQPQLNAAIEAQLKSMSHVMFGGLTHEPAIKLAETLIEITPGDFTRVFFSDSGSVSVEVAIKMAIQYWQAAGKSNKQKVLGLRQAYHGDTLGAMSVCDPVTGMHTLFNDVLAKQYFCEAPQSRFGEALQDKDAENLRNAFAKNHEQLAAFIVEPIVQGAGGMWFYSAEYLRLARELCNEYEVLLIADEIATGFGRSGKLFACEHANIAADILCLGKALTGGYMTLAATLATDEISRTISNDGEGVFMHGPTFMANPLACAVSLSSINLLFDQNWQQSVSRIESVLKDGLSPCKEFDNVVDVRILGAIGVVELKAEVDMRVVPKMFVEHGVWIRPFGKLVYIMPPYIVSDEELNKLCESIYSVVKTIA